MPRLRRSFFAAVALAAAFLAIPHDGLAWGEYGHRLIGRAATDRLPVAMPAFFREAGAQLSYLNPEPDRWRTRAESNRDPALGEGTAPEHFIDTEMAPPAVLAAAMRAPHRFGFIDTLSRAGIDAATMGVLPFAMLETTQRLREAFRRWRTTTDPEVKKWIEARIINDAGILGHYVADGSNPAHTTIHYNGWAGPNPNGYATDRRFHSRFESVFVQAQIKAPEVMARIAPEAKVLHEGDLRRAITEYIATTHREVERLYQIDKAAPFDSTQTAEANRRFAAERLAAGAEMLRDLWWTAWVTSGDPVPARPAR